MTYALLFFIAFILNAMWEFAHSALYIHYQGGAITDFILLRAALLDAFVITAVFLLVSILPSRYRLWAATSILVVFAVFLERWALETGRWAYTEAMPIIFILGTGLSPTIQLALLGYFSIFVAKKLKFPD